MPRRFTKASSSGPTVEAIRWAFAGNTGGSMVGHNQNWKFGTLAAIVYRASGASAGEYPVMIGTINPGAGAEDAVFFFSSSPADQMALWIETAAAERNATPTTGSADGWVLVAVTKTTGTTTPRFHHYKFSTNTWTHTNGGGTQADDAASATDLVIGNGSFNFEAFDGHMAMAASWNQRAMSDGEIERLARGQWARFHPTFLAEFPDGYDKIADAPNLRGCYRPKATLVNGTSKATVVGPPGVRYSTPSRGR